MSEFDDVQEEIKIGAFVSLQTYFEKCGINDPDTACAAAFILDNIAKNYPTGDLITVEPFSSAYEYLSSAGLITRDNPLQMTQLGRKAYEGRPGGPVKVRFIH